MMSYLIIYQNDNIRIYEYSDKKFDILKNNGEEEQKFSENEFWEWWKDKIHYQNEAVGFVVLTDGVSFEIPSFINIADRIEFVANDIHKIFKVIPLDINVISYPIGFTLSPSKRPSSDVMNSPRIIEKSKSSILVEYYEKKTNECNL